MPGKKGISSRSRRDLLYDARLKQFIAHVGGSSGQLLIMQIIAVAALQITRGTHRFDKKLKILQPNPGSYCRVWLSSRPVFPSMISQAPS